MWGDIRRVSAPLLCLFLSMMANGFFTTIISLRIKAQGYSPLIVGLISASYFAGLIFGSFRIERFIARVGYVRVYSTFAALSVILSLAQGYFINEPFLALLIRFGIGICIGVFFVILEGWVLAKSTAKNRGTMMSICMITLNLGYSLGQFFLSFVPDNELTSFVIIALIFSLSIIPLCAIHQPGPDLEEPSLLSFKALYKLTPTGMLGCFMVGMLFSSVYSIFPIMFQAVSYSPWDLALGMFVIVFGGMSGQFPFGKLSDVMERQKVLVYATLFAMALTFVAFFQYRILTTTLLAIWFLMGASLYPLYPIALTHACDVVSKKDYTAAMQGLVLMFSIGSTLGPIFSASTMMVVGPVGVLWYQFIVLGLLLALFIWRRNVSKTIPTEKQKDFRQVGTASVFIDPSKQKTRKD